MSDEPRSDWPTHEPFEQEGYSLACTGCDWTADYTLGDGAGWAAHLQAPTERCSCPHGTAGNRLSTDPECPAHSGFPDGHVHDWRSCWTCEDGSQVCWSCPAPAPHLMPDGSIYVGSKEA